MSTATQPQTETNGTQQPARAPIAAGRRGLSLTTLDEMWRFAQYVASSGLAPKGVESPQAILVALQMGAEVGLTPMASLQNIAVINGRPSLWGDAMLAVCQGSGMFDFESFKEDWSGEKEDFGCTCTVRRLPNGAPTTRTFTVADARKAGLWDKTGPWKTSPRRMLQMRARSFALRDTFSDILRGFHCAEEVMDIEQRTERPSSLSALTARLEKPTAPVSTRSEELNQWADTAMEPAGEQRMAPGEIPLDTPDPPADPLDDVRAALAGATTPAEVSKIGEHFVGQDSPLASEELIERAQALVMARMREVEPPKAKGKQSQKESTP
jgi:hypothetical protein